jgi:hypothetical protein
MIKLEKIGRRHVAGIATLALTLGGLGYFAARDFPGRPVAALPEAQIAQDNTDQSFEEKFLAGLRRLPANAFGSAQGLRLREGQDSIAEGDANDTPDASQNAALSPTSRSKFWSDQEWRIAGKAVDDFRATRKSSTDTFKTGTLSLRPPEEIASKVENPAGK